LNVRAFSVLAAASLLAGLLSAQSVATAAPQPKHRVVKVHRSHVALPVRRSLRVVRVRHVRVVRARGTVHRAKVVPWHGPARTRVASSGPQPGHPARAALLAKTLPAHAAGSSGPQPGHPARAVLLAKTLPADGGSGIQEFPVPTSSSNPLGVAVTPDPHSGAGDAWFTESGGNKIGEVKADGSFTEYPIPSQPNYSGSPRGITVGADGNLWFTTYSYIGRMTPDGSFTFFPITPYNDAYDITAGPDGNVWFTEVGGSVGYVTPNGAVTEYAVGAGIHPAYITGLGGSLWFTATGGGGANYVYQITTGGALTQYVLPSSWTLGDITAGPDGRVWFGSTDTALTAMAADGSYTSYTWPIYPGGYGPNYLRPDASGAIVFANQNGGAIGRMTITGSVSFTSVPSGYPTDGLAIAADGTIWFSEPAGNKIGMLPGGPGQFPPSVPAAQTYGCACGTAYTARPQAYAGAGVNTATGAFTDAFTAAQLPGPGPSFDLTLAYTSADTASGPLGPGWTDSYQAGLSFDGSGNPTFTAGDGQQIPYTSTGGTYTGGPGVYATLAAVQGGYQVTAPDGTQLNFGPSGQLTSETDRSGSGVTLSYNGGQLASATDTGGRTVTFGYNPSGLLSSLTLPDGKSVSYGYTGGQLTSVTEPGSNPTIFHYNSNGRLDTIKDPDGNIVLTNTYDPATGRITAQEDGDGNTTTFAWDPGTQTETITKPGGGVWIDTYNNNVLTEQFDPVGGFTYYSYDSNLDLTQVTDPLGNRTEMSYDGAGNMLSMTAPAPLFYKQKWTYNNFNEVKTYQDGLGQITKYGYDPGNGTLTSVTDPEQHQAIFTYYPDGQLKTAEDAYTSQDDLYTVTDPLGNVTTYGYNANGQLTSITDPYNQNTGLATTATYDPATGRLATVTDPLGDTTSYGYDADGHLTSITDPNNQPVDPSHPSNHPTIATYDNAGHLKTVKDPLGNITTYTYNADGQLATVTDPENNLTQYTYLRNGWLNSITRPDGKQIGILEDQDGRLFAYLDPQGNTTRYFYDGLGRLTTMIDPLDRSTLYKYDADNNPATVTSPDGLVTSYGYNPENRLTSVSYTDGTHPVSYSYYPAGQLKTMTDGTGQSSYSYYDDGTVQAETDGAGNTIGYHYNADGNPKIITYPNGHDVSLGYNAAQEVKNITDWNGNQTAFGYDGDGHLTSQAAPNGDTATTRYNHAGQLTDITDQNAAGTTLADFGYTPVANGETKTATTTGSALSAPDQNYSYNSLGQLTGVNNNSYTYDLAGDPVGLDNPIFTQGFGLADQIVNHEINPTTITSYGFNNRGDRISATTGGNTTSYGYDQANHLTSYTPPAGPATTYAYNGQGLRTAKTTGGNTTSFTWDTAGRLPLMLTAGNTSYIYGPDGLPVESVAGDGTPTYLFHDQIGSTRLLTDPAGAVTGTYTYDAWGNTTSHTGTATTPLQYTGQYLDSETGFYYLRSRYYDPYTAQFLTVDPIVNQTHATYTYAGDNPITGTDPTGLMCVPGMSANANCNDHPVQDRTNGGDPAGSSSQPGNPGCARIAHPVPGAGCLPPSDFLTPSQGRAVAITLGLTFINLLQAGLDPATDAAEVGEVGAIAGGDAASTAGDEVPAFSRSAYGRVPGAARGQVLGENPTCVYCGENPATQIDHINSLRQDWQSGGWSDEPAIRTERVNDPANLTGACAPCNASKGASSIGTGPGEWWPPGWPFGQWWPFGR
jgi:RHS repeat-associated protein